MGYLRISCGNCGESWEVYARDDFNSDNARTCPNCFRDIDPHTWAKEIVPAFGSFEDANRTLANDSTGYGGTLFKVSYINPLCREDHDSYQMELKVADIEQDLEVMKTLLVGC